VKIQFVIASVLFATLSPIAAQAQSLPGGMAYGFHEGNRRAGPLGAVVGTAVGGVVGGVEGVLGINQQYNHPRYAHAGDFIERPQRMHRHRKAARHGRHHGRRARHSAVR